MKIEQSRPQCPNPECLEQVNIWAYHSGKDNEYFRCLTCGNFYTRLESELSRFTETGNE